MVVGIDPDSKELVQEKNTTNEQGAESGDGDKRTINVGDKRS